MMGCSCACEDPGCTDRITDTHPVSAEAATMPSSTRKTRGVGTCSIVADLVPTVGGAQCVVFADGDAHHSGRLGQLAFDALEDVARQILAGGNQFDILELGHIEIDVAMVEPILHLLLENSVEHAEVDDESRFTVDRSANSDVADVAVAVKVGPGAGAKRARIFFIAPLGAAIPMRCAKRDSSGERGGRHPPKLHPFRPAGRPPSRVLTNYAF